MSGFIGATQRNNLAKGIFATDIIPSYSFQIISGYNKISTSFITTGIIIGTGITGYQEVSVGSIPRKNGSFIQICEQSGMLGPLYGEQIIFETGSETGQRIITVTVPEQTKYDFEKLKEYTNNQLKFLYQIDNLDIFEINTFTGFLNNYKFINQYDNNLQQFILDVSSTGQNINLFQNGVFQISGVNVNGTVIDGNYNLSGNRYIDSDLFYNQFEDKLVYFDLVQSPEIINYGGLGSYTLSNDLNNSFYMNGQKLVSGYNYTINGSTVTFTNIDPSITNEKILCTTRISQNYTTYTGYSTVLTGTLIPLGEEQIYLNGILQIDNQDYVKTNCQSLLNNLFYPTVKLYNYYNNDENSFNLL